MLTRKFHPTPISQTCSFIQRKLLSTSGLSSVVKISDEVKQAISENVPVVALESTIITHGLPYPENISMAKNVEKLIRENGAIPASVGFINGVPTVGLNETEIDIMGDQNLRNVKISRRDIPNVMSRNLNGGTTIAATMILANAAGIDVFATGGLGGVSRPWSLFDVSADLEELGKTPVAVVCAGPKSILDIQRTMEYLETKGVPVSTYFDDDMKDMLDMTTKQKLDSWSKSNDPKDIRKLNEFWEFDTNVNVPGFYVRDSGVKSPFVWEDPTVAAKMIFNGKYAMNLENGYVFCAPAPVKVALDNTRMNKIIDEAINLAERENISGKHLTPFLLKTLYEKTNGESAKCNIEFVKNNTIIGSKIATQLCNLKGGRKLQAQPLFQNFKSQQLDENTTPEPLNAMVVGSVAVDTICEISSKVKLHDSNPGKIREKAIGGVGFNVALAATSFDRSNPVALISTLNKDDSAGKLILEKFSETSIPQYGLSHISEESTAQYISIHDSNGELTVACADMGIIEKLDDEKVSQILSKYKPKYVLFDTNISVNVMNAILKRAKELGIKVIIEPTSGVKCGKLGKCKLTTYGSTPVQLVTPTIEELATIHSSFAQNGKFEDIDNWFNILDAIGIGSEFREQLVYLGNRIPLISGYLQMGVFQQAFQLLPYFPNILIKDGSNGVLLVQITSDAESARKSLAKPIDEDSMIDFTLVSKGGRHNLAVVIQHFSALEVANEQIINVTGAGDSLAGCLLAQLANDEKMSKALDNLEERELRELLMLNAQTAAVSSLVCASAVNEPVMRSIGNK